MTATCFVDSNVLIYSFDSRAPRKQQQAARLLKSLWAASNAAISAQVINESLNTLLRLYRDVEPVQMTRERLRPYLGWIKSSIDEPLVRAAWLVSDRYGVSHWDGLIVAAAQRARCDVLYTEDMQAGMVFDGALRVVNPFLEGSEAPQYSVQEPKATYKVKRPKRASAPQG